MAKKRDIVLRLNDDEARRLMHMCAGVEGVKLIGPRIRRAMDERKIIRKRADVPRPVSEMRCPHCHEIIQRPDQHYSRLSRRYDCGDQWVGNDI